MGPPSSVGIVEKSTFTFITTRPHNIYVRLSYFHKSYLRMENLSFHQELWPRNR